MQHLDYLSCCLTVVSTVLVARKRWSGLVLAGINSAIICAIGFRTAQFGFIPANLFCILVYAVSLRSWRRPRRRLTDEQADRAALRFAMGRASADAFFAAPPTPAGQPRRNVAGLKVVHRSKLQHDTNAPAAAENHQILPLLVSSAKR